MKNKKQKMMGIVLMLFLGFAVVFPSMKVRAMGVIDIKKNFKQTVTYSASDKKNGYLLGTYNVLPQNAKKIKVISSKKSVANIKKQKVQGGPPIFFLMPKKTGTTKVTVSAIVGKKTVKYTGTVKIINFKNPFKSLKINGKSYLKQVKGSENLIHIKKSKVKLNYKLKPGWEIDLKSIYGFKQTSVKNNQTYTLKKDAFAAHITIQVKNKKTGEKISVIIETVK